MAVTPLSAPDLAAWLQDTARPAPFLLDVREPHEFTYCALKGAENWPMGQIPAQFEALPSDREIVCICHHGMRSQQVAMFLASRGFENLYNLTGGVHAWATQIDASMPVY